MGKYTAAVNGLQSYMNTREALIEAYNKGSKQWMYWLQKGTTKCYAYVMVHLCNNLPETEKLID